MARVYMSEAEASALVVIVDSYLRSFPQSCTAEIIKKLPARISKCLEMQGKEKAATNKGNG